MTTVTNQDADRNIIEDTDEEEHCSICLQSLVDRTVLPACSHEFCFECILVWMEQSRKCPLCTQGMDDYLLHNIRSRFDYQKYYLTPLRTSPKPLVPVVSSNDGGRPRHRRRERQWGTRRRQEHEEIDRLERAIAHRRWIYEHGLYAKHVASNAYTRYRPYPTPAQFAASQDLISRATVFLRRELRVWNNLDIEFLTTFIISLMKSIDIRSESAVKLLAEFLDMDTPYVEGQRFKNAEHFAHETYSFLRSPYKDLFVYDSVAQYDQAYEPPNWERGSSSHWANEPAEPEAGPSHSNNNNRSISSAASDSRPSQSEIDIPKLHLEHSISQRENPREGEGSTRRDREPVHEREIIVIDSDSNGGMSDTRNEPSKAHNDHTCSRMTIYDHQDPDETSHMHSSHSVLNNSRDNGKGKGRAIEHERPPSTDRQTLFSSSSSIVDITASESFKENKAKITPKYYTPEVGAPPQVTRDNRDAARDHRPPVATTNDNAPATRYQQSHRTPKPRSLLSSVQAHLGLDRSPTTQSTTTTRLSDQEPEQGDAFDHPEKPLSLSSSPHGENNRPVVLSSGAVNPEMIKKDAAQDSCDTDPLSSPSSVSGDGVEDASSAQGKSHADIMAMTRARLSHSKQEKMLDEMAADAEPSSQASKALPTRLNLLERLESEKAHAMSNEDSPIRKTQNKEEQRTSRSRLLKRLLEERASLRL